MFWFLLGEIVTEAGVDLISTEDSHLDSNGNVVEDPFSDRHFRDVSDFFAGLNLENAWNFMSAHAQRIEDATVSYDADQNSNSVFASVLNAAGLNHYAAFPTPPSTPSWPGADNTLPQVVVPTDGYDWDDGFRDDAISARFLVPMTHLSLSTSRPTIMCSMGVTVWTLRTTAMLPGSSRSIGRQQTWRPTISGNELWNIERFTGADFVINGTAGDDVLGGGSGDDTLNGGDGNDVLQGGEGSNILNGGVGDDVLVIDSWDQNSTSGDGGAGNDSLIINHIDNILVDQSSVSYDEGVILSIETVVTDFRSYIGVDSLGTNFDKTDSAIWRLGHLDYSRVGDSLAFEISGDTWTITDGLKTDFYNNININGNGTATDRAIFFGTDLGDTFNFDIANFYGNAVYLGIGDDTVNLVDDVPLRVHYFGGNDEINSSGWGDTLRDIDIFLPNSVNSHHVTFIEGPKTLVDTYPGNFYHFPRNTL